MDAADPRGVATVVDERTEGRVMGIALLVVDSSSNRVSLCIRLAFSSLSLLFSSSRSFTASSNPHVRSFFRSRAVWAATRFFIFLLAIFSSAERAVSRSLFRVFTMGVGLISSRGSGRRVDDGSILTCAEGTKLVDGRAPRLVDGMSTFR